MATFTLTDVYRGDHIPINITITQTVSGVTSALNLTGYTIWCTAKRNIGDADVDAVWQEKTPGVAGLSGVTITNAAAGQAQAVIPAARTDSLTADTTLLVEFQIKSPTGVISTPASGTITIIRDVTRTTT